jgi:hypothetical protein
MKIKNNVREAKLKKNNNSENDMHKSVLSRKIKIYCACSKWERHYSIQQKQKKKLKNTINLWFFCIGLQLNCAFNVISASYNYDNDFPLFVNLHLFIQTEHFHVQFLEK